VVPIFRRRRPRLIAHTVDGPRGPVRVRVDRWPQGLVAVDGPGMPAIGLAVLDIGIAALAVDAVKAPLSCPDRWTLRRRSRRIRAEVAGRCYELRPIGGRRSRLTRDGVDVADASGGWAVYLPWHLSLPGQNARLTWRPWCEATDVAVGYALVIGFGAGSPGFLINLAWALLEFVS
jgi:hypothetical protein